MRQKWTSEEIQIIQDNYKYMSDEELHNLIPLHSKTSIESKRKDMGLIRPKFKKYSFDDVLLEFSKKENYTLLSTQEEYKNCNSKMRYICNKHIDKGEQSISLNHIQSGRGCYYCGLESTASKRKIELDKKSDRILCESKNFEYIDTIRKNGKITIVFICNNHRDLGKQHMTKNNMKRDINGCKYCAGRELPEWYVLQKAEEINPFIQLLEPYKNLTTRMNCFCTKHNCNTHKSMQDILNGHGCYYCGIEKLSEQHSLSLDDYQNKVNSKNPNIMALKYNGINTNAKFKCILCGAEWYSNANSIKQCPSCMKFYTGEKLIAQFLNKWGIPYKEQYRFNCCRDKRPLPFDFYLYKNNLCIEFDGQQHFEQKNGWTDLRKVQEHDSIKNEFCKRNKIRLIRIPYWEQDDIEYQLFDKLIKYNVLEEKSSLINYIK